ncbi:polyprotein [Gossypium australe]|uniref:Polyprotein n=1 Tax=Gossypium australe TaxID=47621 RepID=A0A5B6WMY7_9ROSI|nr:polyprotein [Gossypium australe]
MLQAGIIMYSSSSFAFLIVMVKKKYDSWRMCVDYRQLNQLTIKEKFSIPIIESNCTFAATTVKHLEFCVDINASSQGVGVVSRQKVHPIAFFSKALSIRHQALSTYEKEMLAVLFVVKKWNSYLIGCRFKVKTNHQSLRFLTEQQAITPFQQRWATMMFGYDFKVVYRKGRHNIVADALSIREQQASSQLF